MREDHFGLYDSTGVPIIEYGGIEGLTKDILYLYISTLSYQLVYHHEQHHWRMNTFVSTAVWTIQPSGCTTGKLLGLYDCIYDCITQVGVSMSEHLLVHQQL